MDEFLALVLKLRHSVRQISNSLRHPSSMLSPVGREVDHGAFLNDCAFFFSSVPSSVLTVT